MPSKNDKPQPSLEDFLNEDKTPAGSKVDTSANDSVVAPTGATNFENAELEALRAQLAEAQAKLAESEAKIAESEQALDEKNHPTDDEGRPLPEEALTPQQRALRAREDRLARENGKSLDKATAEVEETDEGILIHILEDGFTAMGSVRYRGEELLFGPKAFEETLDRNGESWLYLDDSEQFELWGSIKFRHGPWPGKRTYEDPELQNKQIRNVAPVIRY